MGRFAQRRVVGSVLVALVLVVFGAASVPARADEPPVADDAAGAAQLLALANVERTAAGLPLLQVNNTAAELAGTHSRQMAAAGDIFHNDGYFTSEVRERLGAKSLGENVAMNRSVEDAHRRLMLSPGHRANLMNPQFTEVGMAVARSADGTGFITQDFLEPAAPKAVPTVVPAPAPEPPAAEPEPSPAPRPAPAPTSEPGSPAPHPPTAGSVADAAVGAEAVAGQAAVPEATTTTGLEVVSVVTEPISSSPTASAPTSPAGAPDATPTLLLGTIAVSILVLVAVAIRRMSLR